MAKVLAARARVIVWRAGGPVVFLFCVLNQAVMTFLYIFKRVKKNLDGILRGISRRNGGASKQKSNLNFLNPQPIYKNADIFNNSVLLKLFIIYFNFTKYNQIQAL